MNALLQFSELGNRLKSHHSKNMNGRGEWQRAEFERARVQPCFRIEKYTFDRCVRLCGQMRLVSQFLQSYSNAGDECPPDVSAHRFRWCVFNVVAEVSEG